MSGVSLSHSPHSPRRQDETEREVEGGEDETHVRWPHRAKITIISPPRSPPFRQPISGKGWLGLDQWEGGDGWRPAPSLLSVCVVQCPAAVPVAAGVGGGGDSAAVPQHS